LKTGTNWLRLEDIFDEIYPKDQSANCSL